MRKIEVDLGELLDITSTLYTGCFEREYFVELIPKNITDEEIEEYLERYRKEPYTEEDVEEQRRVIKTIVKKIKNHDYYDL